MSIAPLLNNFTISGSLLNPTDFNQLAEEICSWCGGSRLLTKKKSSHHSTHSVAMNFGMASSPVTLSAAAEDGKWSEKGDGEGEMVMEGLLRPSSLSTGSNPHARIMRDGSTADRSSLATTPLSPSSGAADHDPSTTPSPAAKLASNKMSKRRLETSTRTCTSTENNIQVATNLPMFPFPTPNVFNTNGPFPPPWMWMMPQTLPGVSTSNDAAAELFKRFTQWHLFQCSLMAAFGNNPALFMPPLNNFLASLPISQDDDSLSVPFYCKLSQVVADEPSAASSGGEDEEQPLDLSIPTATAAELLKRGSGSDVSLPNLATAESPNDSASSHDDDNKSIDKKHFADIASILQGDSKLQPGSGKRNYSQDDLNAAVLDIRSGRLGTRRASVVYGIPRSTLRNKIYKLEAADDNGEAGSSKRRRLSALADRKRERSRVTDNEASDGPSGGGPATLGEQGESHGTGACSSSFENAAASAIIDQSQPPAPDRKPQKKKAKSAATSSASTLICSSPAGDASTVAPPPTLLGSSFLNPFAEIIKQYVGNFNPTPVGMVDNGDSATAKTVVASGLEQSSDLGKEMMKAEPDDTPVDMAKKQRPKRGQYRKYEKGALERAVASVRSGEMSVHRAGSFYGVPHSTLEYKVKERNLLRHKNKQKLLSAAAEQNSAATQGTPLSSSLSAAVTTSESLTAGAASLEEPVNNSNSTEPVKSDC